MRYSSWLFNVKSGQKIIWGSRVPLNNWSSNLLLVATHSLQRPGGLLEPEYVISFYRWGCVSYYLLFILRRWNFIRSIALISHFKLRPLTSLSVASDLGLCASVDYPLLLSLSLLNSAPNSEKNWTFGIVLA